jgi:hypothetical protein
MLKVSRPTLLALLLAAVAAILPGSALALQKPFAGHVALDDARLDSFRGGLDAGQSLVLSIGLQRTVSINGEVMVQQFFNLSDVAVLMQGGTPSVQLIASLTQVVQNGPGNTVGGATSPAPATAAPAAVSPGNGAAPAAVPSGTGGAGTASPVATPAVATPSAAPAAAAGPPATAPPNPAPQGPAASASAAPAATPAAAAAPVAAPGASPTAAPAFITMQVAGTTVMVPNAPAIVQNSMHHAMISVMTSINLAANALSAARSLQNAAMAAAAAASAAAQRR